MEYRDFTEADIERYISDYNKYLNEGVLTADKVKKALARDEYFGSIAEENGEIAGYFTFTDGIAFTYPHKRLQEKVKNAAGSRHINTADALLVIPGFRGRGVATGLAERNKRLLTERKQELFLTEIWIYPDGQSPAKMVYDRMGKVVWSETIPLFYNEAQKYGISCPLCGKNCRCGAYIHVIDVKE